MSFCTRVTALDSRLRGNDGGAASVRDISIVVPAQAGTQRLSLPAPGERINSFSLNPALRKVSA